MTDTSLAAAPRIRDDAAAAGPGLGMFLVLLGALTLVRLAGLRLSAVDLFFDESQYWVWSQELAFGYFSKPPMIAWIIAAAEQVCGSAEACIRSPAPLFYFGTAIGVYAIAGFLYGRRAAFWAGLTAALAPGVVYSARVISTDVPLLFFWTLALLAFVRLRAGGSRGWAVLLAAAFGLGLLAKYAMIYCVPCILVAAIVDPRSRALLRDWPVWAGLAAGLFFLLPNLVWNLDHGLVTVTHTGGNISGPGMIFRAGNGFGFLAEQFGIGGPVVFAVLLILAIRLRSASVTPDDRTMVAFSLPVFLMLAAVAFVAKANSNWAAPGFIAAFIVAPAVLVRQGRMALVVFGVALGIFCQVVLIAADAYADRISLPFLKHKDVYARTMGWEPLGVGTRAAVERTGARSVVAGERQTVSSILYYGRGLSVPVYAWPPDGAPEDHFELTRPLPADAPEPVLAIGSCSNRGRYERLYGSVEDAGTLTAPTGPTSARTYCLRLLSGRKG